MKFDFVAFDWKGTLAPKRGEKGIREEAGLRGIAEEFKHEKRVLREYEKHKKRAKELELAELKVITKGQLISNVLSDLDLTEEQQRNGLEIFYEKHNSAIQSSEKKQMYPGARELLTKLKEADIPIALVRNSTLDNEEFQKVIVECDADSFFDVKSNIILSGEVGFLKPHPNIFLATLTKCGKEHLKDTPHRVLFVGNETEADIRGAKSVGWHTVLIRTTEQSSGGLASWEIDNVRELDQIIFGE